MMYRILENATKDDVELREIIGDAIGNPEEMRRRVRLLLRLFASSIFPCEAFCLMYLISKRSHLTLLQRRLGISFEFDDVIDTGGRKSPKKRP